MNIKILMGMSSYFLSTLPRGNIRNMVACHERVYKNQAGWTKIMFSVYGTWQPRISTYSL